ncbi:MAG: DNA alkylation repair protein [Spirochaetia bacterium]|nr:DNA alkylation repair protein [Spirochaetia bacterium]
MQFIEQMRPFQDEKYRLFTKNIIKEGLPVYGIRSKDTKEIAKQMKLSSLFEDIEKDQYHEQRLIRLLILAQSKIDEGERIILIDKILPFINSWALCDSFCSALKSAKKEPEMYIFYIEKQSKASYSYRVRFALVMLNAYYHTPLYLQKSLSIIASIHRGEKEVMMAKGWAIVTMLSHNPTAVLQWYKNVAIEEKVHKIVVQKGRESRLVNEETITILKLKKAFID